MLRLEKINAGYAYSRILHDLNLDLGEHRIVALLGRNGVGKTTTFNAIMGLLKVTSGSLTFDGRDLTRLPAGSAALLGISLVPQGRRIFPEFTVMENLRVGVPNGRVKRDILDWIFHLFPRLQERLGQAGGSLSGGEQQMLAIARALAMDPRLMLMDEPMEGLSPGMTGVVRHAIVEARNRGVRILIVEQDVDRALELAEDVYIMEKGTTRVHCSPQALQENPGVLERHLGLRLDAA